MKKEKLGTAFGMSYEAFCEFLQKHDEVDGEYYRNHQIHGKDESFISFLKKGSESLKKNSTICKNLC